MRVFSGLRIRLLLLVLIAGVPALGFMLYAAAAQHRLVTDRGNEEALRVVRLASDAHRRSIEEARGLLEGLAHTPAVRGRRGDECSSLFADILAHAPRYANLGALTPEGEAFCSALPMKAPIDLSHRSYFQRAKATRDFALGDYQIGRITERGTINVAYPSLDDGGSIVAIVYAALDLEWLGRTTREMALPGGALVTLFDAQGVVLMQEPLAEGMVGRSASDPLTARMLAGRKGIFEGRSSDGVSRVFAFAPLDGAAGAASPIVSVGIPTQTITGRTNSIFALSFVGIAAAALLALAAAWKAGNILLVDKLRALVKATERLSAGDLGARAGLPGGDDELSALGRSFDEMARSLAAVTRQNRLILESAGEGICGLDLAGRVTFANRAAGVLTGHEEGDLLGASLHDLVHEEGSHPRDACPLLSPLRESLTPHDAPDVFRRKDGSAFPVDSRVSAISEDDVALGVAVIFSDASERRRLEEQFRQVQKMEAVGRVAGGVAHDFNNLLTVIMGFAGLLKRRLPEGDKLREDVAQILLAAERAATLTRQLLAFSRRQVLDPKVMDLNAVVAATTGMIERVIGEDIRLTKRLDPDIGPIRADPGQIEQILMNLAVNARDALPRGGKLTIETATAEPEDTQLFVRAAEQPAPQVVLSVTDDGVGMDLDTQSRIFEPFFTTKEVGKGTGLGLSTVYGIVKQSGGEIAVESARGRGTTFRIYFPRVDAEVEPSAAAPSTKRPEGGTETILVAEDEERIRTLVERALGAAGYAVIGAGSAEEALRKAAAHAGPIHLLLTDIVMPGAGGIELAKRLAAARPRVKTLFMSGYAGAGSDEQALRASVTYIQKPFTPGALLRRIRALLDA